MVILAHFAVTNDLHEKNDSFCPKMAISEIFRPKNGRFCTFSSQNGIFTDTMTGGLLY